MGLMDRAIGSSLNHGASELTRVDYLDGWRGLAISFVLIDHFLPIGFFNAQMGRLGVDVFFVLSGFLMSQILFVKQVDLSTFYKRRISRILPVFLVFVCSLYLVSYIFQISDEHHNFIYAVTFLRSYMPLSPDSWNAGIPIGHIWSLNVEMHCYVVLSLIAVIGAVRRRAYLVLFMLGFAALAIHLYYQKNADNAPPLYFLRTEVASSHLFISAGYFLIKDKFEPWVKSWMPALALLLAVLCYSQIIPYTFSWLLTPFLLAFSLSHLNVSSAFLLSFFSFRFLRILGIWSYSIYLWQEPFFIYQSDFDGPKWLVGCVALALAIATGAISFYIIENPIRKYINNRW